MDPTEFEPFIEGAAGDDSPTARRAAAASRTPKPTRAKLPGPRAGKARAVLHQPRRPARPAEWVLAIVLGAFVVWLPAFGLSRVLDGHGVGATIFASVFLGPIIVLGFALVILPCRAMWITARGRQPAVLARATGDGWVRLSASGRRGGSLLQADGGEIRVASIRDAARPRGVATAHKVTLERGTGGAGEFSFTALGGFDDEAFLQLKSGLAAYGLRMSQLASELPDVMPAESTEEPRR